MQVWFQALVGCLKLTNDPNTLSKEHKGVFWSLRGKFGSIKEYESVHTADFAPYKSKLELLRRQKKGAQAAFKAPLHSKCCIGGFRETGLALVIVLRCN